MALACGVALAMFFVAIAGVCTFTQSPSQTMRTAPKPPPPPRLPPRKTPMSVSTSPDPMVRLRAEWLADPRPAWETVEVFERDVERVLHGDITRQASRMPLRPPPRPSDSPMAKPRGRTYVVVGADGEPVTIHTGMAAPTLDPASPVHPKWCPGPSWDGPRCNGCGYRLPF